MQYLQEHESQWPSAVTDALHSRVLPMGHQTADYSPLALDGWLTYNCERWGLRAERVELYSAAGAVPSLQCVLYFNKRGRIINPPYNPYTPVQLSVTPTESCTRLSRQWLALGAMLAERFTKHGLASAIPIDPVITDARPFQWAGMRENLRYTLHLDLPLDIMQTEHDARKNIAKALRFGYYCSAARDTSDIISCLSESETRKGFQFNLGKFELELLLSLIGPGSLVSCVCYAPDGEPAAARVLLLTPGAPAIDWMGGTKTRHLQSGATQLSLLYALTEAHRRGASAFDFAGANIHRVANAKMKWRGRIVPYLLLQEYGLRSLTRFLLEWRKAAKLKRSSG